MTTASLGVARRLLTILAGLCCGVLASAADGPVFRADFADGTIPTGISDNTYKGTPPAIAVVAEGAAGGKALQIAVAEGGFAQVQLGEFALGQGVTYHAQVTISATPDAPLRLFFRQRGAPYTTYMATEVTAGSTPTVVEVSGVMSEACREATLMLFTEARTTVRLSQLLITRSGGPVDGALANGGFEGAFIPVAKGTSPKAQIDGEIGAGWQDDSGWGEVSLLYARETNGAQSGAAAQRMQVRSIGQGGAQFCQKVHLTAGRVYRVSAWLRAASNNRSLIQLREVGAPYTTWAKSICGLSPEWRRFEFLARMPVDSEALLMFNPEDPGTYWIDDLALSDVTDTLGAGAAVRDGNLWTNGSFEAGLSSGWSMAVGGFDDEVRWAANETLDLQPRLDATTAAEGAGSIAVDLPPWTAGMLTSPLTGVALGRPCTASVALRSDVPRHVGLGLLGTDADVDVEVGPQWQRFSVTGTAMTGTEVRLRVRCVNRDEVPASFWIDAAMFEDADHASADYRRPFPVELALAVPRPGGIVVDGEAAPITVHAVGYDGKLPAGARLACTIENLAGTVKSLPPVALPATGFTIPVDAAAPRGLFKIRARVVDAAGTALSGEVERLFTRLPRPRSLTPAQEEASYFGAHVELTSEKLAIAKATGAHWVRLHDAARATLWPVVEARRGTLVWHDEGVKAARAAGLHVLGMLGGAPPWASRKPQAETGYFSLWSLPDADGAAEQWAAYAGATVSHFKPWVTTWEVWNEPWVNGAKDTFFPSGSPELYGDLLRRASAAARAADPATTVVGVCTSTGDPAWLQRVLAVAGPDQFDAMSFHYYGGRLQGGDPTPMMRTTAILNQAQSARGPAKPLWDSEGGISDNASWYRQPAAALHFQMASQVRLDVAQLAAGVRRFFPYTMHGMTPQGQEEHALLEFDRVPKSSLVARAILASEVEGAVYAGRSEPLPGVEAHAFRHPDGSVVQVLWSNDNQMHALPLLARQKPLDVLGNPLTAASVQLGDEPIYLHGR